LYCGAQLTDYDFSYPLTVIGLNNAYGFYTKRYAKDVFSAVSQLQDVHLIIKPHYNGESLWQEYLSSFEKTVSYELLTHKTDILKLLITSDLVITPESTVICEAIFLKKPVIVLNYSPEELSFPYYEDDGLILHARNPADLSRMVRQALEDQQYREELARSQEKHFVRYAGSFDGHNADRVADYIIESELHHKKAGCDVNSK
jgi:CDP-glycerol glycerophosphotransferase (TagB/SpsB family)